jgi:hypothetical protein
MDGQVSFIEGSPELGLPSARRLLLFAILLPAIVAITNQVTLATLSPATLRWWFFPLIVSSTAVLSWFTGRYLYPMWLRSMLFAWSLALLDLLIFIACIDRRVESQLGFVLVSAQFSLLVLWAVLGTQPWQWRLPAIAALVPVVVVFADSFVGVRQERAWNVIMFVTAAIVAVLCCGLRFSGFMLRELGPSDEVLGNKPAYQFSMKHMLIWFTVSGPLLLLARGIDFQGSEIFPIALLAFSVATVNLIAIWAVLGSGIWPIRVVAVAGVPFVIAYWLVYYAGYLKANATRPWYNYYGTIKWMIDEMKDYWIVWLCLDAALLAALLLFFRACGYRLMRLNAENKRVA